MLTRVCLVAAGPVTLVLVARRFSPELQGFYFTFTSLVALQSFVELGFYIVVINLASHEWSSLSLDGEGRIVGDPGALSRLISLGRLTFKWYAAASAIFVAGVSALGYVFFTRTAHPGVDWQGPWFALVALTGVLLWALPFNSLLEGCNQVAEVNRFRLSQVFLGNLALWATIVLGGGLWASVVWALVSVVRDLYLLLVRYGRFFEPFFRPPAGPRIHWKSEIWPMQWRLGLSGMVTYFAFSLFTPVMFRYHGVVTAGRMGMTWAVVTGLLSVATAYVQVRAPRFGIHVARREFADLDRLFVRALVVALVLLLTGGVGVWLAVVGLNTAGSPLAGRFLPPLPTALLLMGSALLLISSCQSTYLRAHKQEPILRLSVSSSLTIGLLVWLLGSRYGPVGAAAGFAAVYLAALVWGSVIWSRCRALWHQ
jgi:O-antigen/teichoic acid export membrane protein